MRFPQITKERAFITKHKNPYYPEEHYDYTLNLNKKEYDELREIGVNAKTVHNKFTGEDVYFIHVTPIPEPDIYNPLKRIPAPSDYKFLERTDVDITFTVYSVELAGRKITKLYFYESGIEKSKGETK